MVTNASEVTSFVACFSPHPARPKEMCIRDSLNTINPQDIESISVLKDAAASSIYGSRAPFGVVLVTTNSGKSGRPVINYNNSFRFNTPIKMPNMMNAWEYVNYYDEAMFNKNSTHYYTEEYKQKVDVYKRQDDRRSGLGRESD